MPVRAKAAKVTGKAATQTKAKAKAKTAKPALMLDKVKQDVAAVTEVAISTNKAMGTLASNYRDVLYRLETSAMRLDVVEKSLRTRSPDALEEALRPTRLDIAELIDRVAKLERKLTDDHPQPTERIIRDLEEGMPGVALFT